MATLNVSATSWRLLSGIQYNYKYVHLLNFIQTTSSLTLHEQRFQPIWSSSSKPEATMTESEQRPEAVTNRSKTTNGVLTPSTTSSYDKPSNAWSTPGSAAFDFRSASSPHPTRTFPKFPIQQSSQPH